MKIKHYQGTVVDVPEEKARRMRAGGSWTYVDSAPEGPAEAVEETPKGGHPQDAPPLPERPSEGQEEAPEPQTENELVAEGPKPPSIPEIRKWALKNNVEGAKPQGKLSRSVIEAYMEAHKE
jgi:hypothetical protein